MRISEVIVLETAQENGWRVTRPKRNPDDMFDRWHLSRGVETAELVVEKHDRISVAAYTRNGILEGYQTIIKYLEAKS
jgi:hypothetical protein